MKTERRTRGHVSPTRGLARKVKIRGPAYTCRSASQKVPTLDTRHRYATALPEPGLSKPRKPAEPALPPPTCIASPPLPRVTPQPHTRLPPHVAPCARTHTPVEYEERLEGGDQHVGAVVELVPVDDLPPARAGAAGAGVSDRESVSQLCQHGSVGGREREREGERGRERERERESERESQ